jgi:ribulose 1,5-bisphosphate synthetase/thiazole synthase
MKKISEAARTVDVILETDVLVVGSGPGGLAAALAAARYAIEYFQHAKGLNLQQAGVANS